MNRTSFRIDAGHPCLDGHFPNAAIVPGVVILDRVIEAVHTAGTGCVTGVYRCKFLAILYPGEACIIEWTANASSARFACRGPAGLLAQGVLRIETTPRG